MSSKRISDTVQSLLSTGINSDEITFVLIIKTLSNSGKCDVIINTSYYIILHCIASLEDERCLVSLVFNDLHKDGGMSSLLFMKVIVIN